MNGLTLNRHGHSICGCDVHTPTLSWLGQLRWSVVASTITALECLFMFFTNRCDVTPIKHAED